METTAPFVLLDDMRMGQERMTLFCEPVATFAAWEPRDVERALERVGQSVADGLHAAGYLSYELGYILEPRLLPLLPARRDIPLLWFALFDRHEELSGADVTSWFKLRRRGRGYAGPLHFTETAESYKEKFHRARDYINAGDVYQANLTFGAQFAFLGDPLALYERLREDAGAGHGAYLFDGTRNILSFSPEQFFAVTDGMLTARPMKGTAPRAEDPATDTRLRDALCASEKNRAENLMIVDLIRNDLGRVAKIGTVRARELFAVETYPTVHQMVSTVSAELSGDVTVSKLVRAIFPCGSVTGTPKIRAMEVIRELETDPRGVYCGAIGAFSPDGVAAFNVAIRTLTIADGSGRVGVGSAVVADSKVGDEYEECLLKARYYQSRRRSISLIETLLHLPREGFIRSELHLARLARSAMELGLPFDRGSALQALENVVADKNSASRVRLQMYEDGTFDVESTPFKIPVPGTVWTYVLSNYRVQSTDPLARHKTSWRKLFDEEREAWNAKGCDEVLYLNERGEVAEGSATTIFAQNCGRLVTPPLSSGVLDGCLRHSLLDTGECEEGVLFPNDLARADVVYLGNSLRGLIRAVPITGEVLPL